MSHHGQEIGKGAGYLSGCALGVPIGATIAIFLDQLVIGLALGIVLSGLLGYSFESSFAEVRDTEDVRGRS